MSFVSFIGAADAELVDMLTERSLEHNGKISTLEKKVDELSNEILQNDDSLDERIIALNNKLDYLAKRHSQVQDIEQIETSIKVLTNRVTRVTMDISDLKKELHGLYKKMTDAQSIKHHPNEPETVTEKTDEKLVGTESVVDISRFRYSGDTRLKYIIANMPNSVYSKGLKSQMVRMIYANGLYDVDSLSKIRHDDLLKLKRVGPKIRIAIQQLYKECFGGEE